VLRGRYISYLKILKKHHADHDGSICCLKQSKTRFIKLKINSNSKNIPESRFTPSGKRKDKEYQNETLLIKLNPLTLRLTIFVTRIGINNDFLSF
jgi:hypothetical protein